MPVIKYIQLINLRANINLNTQRCVFKFWFICNVTNKIFSVNSYFTCKMDFLSDNNLDAAVQVSDIEIGSCDNSRTSKQLQVNKSENEADFLHQEVSSSM